MATIRFSNDIETCFNSKIDTIDEKIDEKIKKLDNKINKLARAQTKKAWTGSRYRKRR